MEISKLATYINELRIIPRLMVAFYGLLCWNTTNWFMGLTEPTGAQATFIATVIGAAGAIFGLYTNTGGSR